MDHPPETRYARCCGLSIAYQCYGDGSEALVYMASNVSHLEASWTIPAFARYYRRLGRFARVVRFDRRGTGLSDRLPSRAPASLDEGVDDLITVMDAVGLEQATVFGAVEGGPIGILAAVRFPERVRSLVLYGTWACLKRSDDYPLGFSEVEQNTRLEQMRAHWGSDASPWGLDMFEPRDDDDGAWRLMLARIERMALTPVGAVDLQRWRYELDLRALLPEISVPTLVLHKIGDRIVPIEHGRYLASRIPGARLIELQGMDPFPMFGDPEAVPAAVEEFMTGRRPPREPERTVASILFADIVGSTSTARSLGDRRWTDLLEQHEDALRAEIAAHDGRVVNTAGDGVFALFPTPGRAIHCAQSLQMRADPLHLQIRAGIHTGEVEVRDARVSGIAVHIGARIAAAARPGEILVSRTVRDLVAGSGFSFLERGAHELKGLGEAWDLFAVSKQAG
jgi:class 3 adenylate cyclase